MGSISTWGLHLHSEICVADAIVITSVVELFLHHMSEWVDLELGGMFNNADASQAVMTEDGLGANRYTISTALNPETWCLSYKI